MRQPSEEQSQLVGRRIATEYRVKTQLTPAQKSPHAFRFTFVSDSGRRSGRLEGHVRRSEARRPRTTTSVCLDPSLIVDVTRGESRASENWNYARARIKPRNNELLIAGRTVRRAARRRRMLMIRLN